MKLIIGLGNPGLEYQNTRHNAGYMCIDKICEKLNISLDKSKFNTKYFQGFINDKKVIVAKPETYMNLSGESVGRFVDYFDIELEDILIIYDDMDTDVGSIRIRSQGNSGRQKGMDSIISHLKSTDFSRIRIGIGRNKLFDNPSYVLGKFTGDELESINDSLDEASDASIEFINKTIDKIMNKYNVKK